MDNARIAERLDAFAALLELNGSSFYTTRAYRRAAELIRTTPADVAAVVRAGRARELRGIGPGIEARLRELVETGELEELRQLESEVMPELVAVGRLLGLSPKRMRELGSALDVRTLEELRAVEPDRLESVPGIGPKTATRIREGLAGLRHEVRPRHGLTLNRARALVDEIAAALGGEPAGDPRRFCDLSTRLAVVVPSTGALLELERLPQIVSVLEREDNRAVGVTVEGIPVEVIAAEAGGFGTALLEATGSPEYVASLGPLPERATEVEVYTYIRCPFRPPELRELDAADPPPDLLELEHVRGDLHMHSTASDGKATVLELGLAARELGYEYIAICDHTKAVRVVEGLDADGLRRQAEEIAVANEELAPFRILRGSECDILPDGALDLPDDVLARARVGADQPPRRPARTGRRADGARRRGHATCGDDNGSVVPLASARPDPQPPPGERTRSRPRLRGCARDRRRAGGERPARQARPLRHARPPRTRRRGEDRLLDRRPLRARAPQHGALGRNGAARRRAHRRRPQHAPARGAPYAAVAPGPRAPYSRTSNQWVASSASATSGSVCSA